MLGAFVGAAVVIQVAVSLTETLAAHAADGIGDKGIGRGGTGAHKLFHVSDTVEGHGESPADILIGKVFIVEVELHEFGDRLGHAGKALGFLIGVQKFGLDHHHVDLVGLIQVDDGVGLLHKVVVDAIQLYGVGVPIVFISSPSWRPRWGPKRCR